MTTNVLKTFLMTMLLQIVIVEVAQVQVDVVADQVVATKIWGRDVADVRANIHVDVANDDVDVLVAMHLDVVTICCCMFRSDVAAELHCGKKSRQMRFVGFGWFRGCVGSG